MRGYVLVVGCTISLFACGGGGEKKVKKPKPKKEVEETVKAETPEDREKARHDQAVKIVPEGSTCLPASLKEDGAPRLELAASGSEAILCALDEDQNRLLGPVGCWKINLANGELEYKGTDLPPGRGVWVKLDESCAKGYCLKSVKSTKALVAKDLDGKKVAVLAGDDVHLFDAESKEESSSFSIRGDKGLTNDPKGMVFVGDHVAVEGADEGPYSAVWVFKTDGTQLGPVTMLGGKEEKPVSTYKGSLSVLDKNRIAVADHGMETLTTYQLDNGARGKLVRKLKAKPACKPVELDAYWHEGDKVTDKCKDSIEKGYGLMMGATLVAGAKNNLALLRGDRLGDLGVLDPKSLEEKKAIKLPWCAADAAGAGGGGGGGGGDADEESKDEAKDAKKDSKESDAAPADKKKGKSKPGDTSDPQEGGQ
ncbi:MAG TPA: hypothetical protein VMZ53_07510 [Kofleriaceae bacterium]|nr:hypothetical protein [Kofleriaceae bacterium]